MGIIWIIGYYWADLVIGITRVFSKMRQRLKRRRVKPAKQANVYKNVEYKSDYPNNKLDIFIPSHSSHPTRSPEENRIKEQQNTCDNENDMEIRPALYPVIVYFHGGGFAWGDKIDERRYLLEFVKQGYAVISANYALTPTYKYPVPIIQASNVMDFVASEGQRYGLDLDNVVLAGL